MRRHAISSGARSRPTGTRVHVTQDGSEALECVEGAGAQKFDVLVSDVEMPLLDGVSLAQRALKQPDLRVLLMSGFAEQLDRAKSLKGSQVAVLSKPFTLEEVRVQRAQAARLVRQGSRCRAAAVSARAARAGRAAAVAGGGGLRCGRRAIGLDVDLREPLALGPGVGERHERQLRQLVELVGEGGAAVEHELVQLAMRQASSTGSTSSPASLRS